MKLIKQSSKHVRSGGIDRPLLIAVGALLGFGLLMIASAGVAYGEVRFGDEYFFLKEQLIGLIVGGLALFLCSRIDYHVWQRFVIPIFLIAVALLVLVFIPGFGTNAYGATRWLALGPLSFQPSEVMKLSIILYLAAWLASKRREKRGDFFEGFIPFLAVISLVGFLIFKQPDAGTLGLILLISLAIFFASGANITHIAALCAGGIALLAILIHTASYRLDRFVSFLNPDHDPLGIGYQIRQALLALGSGGFLGAGLGHGKQKFSYLPEPVTDSIFAVIGEELGFFGSALAVGLFLYIGWRGLRVARRAPDDFGRLVAVGIVSWICIQAFVNIAAISGLIPLTGIPLPFISYGGTSLAVLMASVGILLNISKQARIGL